VWWFRLPRHAGDPDGAVGRFSTGHLAGMLDRGSYWQCVYVIEKGANTALRAAGLDAWRNQLATLLPWTSDRLDNLRDWDDVKLLTVQVDRARRWFSDGLLLIGDAAHAMSPGRRDRHQPGHRRRRGRRAAAGRTVAHRPSPPPELALVQLRRWWPAALIRAGNAWPTGSCSPRRSACLPQPPSPQPALPTASGAGSGHCCCG